MALVPHPEQGVKPRRMDPNTWDDSHIMRDDSHIMAHGEKQDTRNRPTMPQLNNAERLARGGTVL